MNLVRIRLPKFLPGLVLLAVLCLLAPVAVARAGGEPPANGQCSGYYYTVKLGDTWSRLARRVGTSIDALKSANPQAVRPRDVIYAGERLCIPSTGGVQEGGYWYQVRPGDTWYSVARATGVPVEQLWAANRRLVNRRQWLYIGQTIWIPALPKGVTPEPVLPPAEVPSTAEAAPVATSAPVEGLPTAVVTATTASTAVAPVEVAPSATEVPAATAAATAAAPTATTVPTATPTATATATAVPPPTSTPSPTRVAAQPATAAPEPSNTPPPAASPVPAATAAPTTGPTATLPPLPADCPKSSSAYADAIGAYLNKAGNTPAALQTWLEACRIAGADGQPVTVAPITGPKAHDAIVIVQDSSQDAVVPPGTLLIYHQGAKGYTLAHTHEGQGSIALLKAADVNADGKVDIVYSDTSCGAHTCFGTLFVDSWDGKTYQDWITDEPTMAYPEYSFKDASKDGQGEEILVHGGVIGSVGAGPQRAWTETYVSSKGAPYVLFSQVYDPSTCLYHKILDANRAFDAWALDGFEPAIEAYKAAIADTSATACGSIKDEVATLRDFARFRLIVADVAAGMASDSANLPDQITNKALAGAATTFLKSYKDNSSVIQACRDTTKYAEGNPASWQFLADWGYANPSFTAPDLCSLS